MKIQLKMLLKVLAISSIFLLISCAQTPKNINWNDPRCVTFSDAYLKQSEQRKGDGAAVFFSILGGDFKQTNIALNGGGVRWIEGYSGDSKMVWVGYNERQEVMGYRDTKGTDLTLADLKILGGVITKYSNLAELDPTYQYKFQNYKNLPDKDKPFLAAKLPKECDISKN